MQLEENEVPRGGLLGKVTQHVLGRTESQAPGPSLAKGTMGLFLNPRRKTDNGVLSFAQAEGKRG